MTWYAVKKLVCQVYFTVSLVNNIKFKKNFTRLHSCAANDACSAAVRNRKEVFLCHDGGARRLRTRWQAQSLRESTRRGQGQSAREHALASQRRRPPHEGA